MSKENVERFHHALRQWYDRQQIGSDLLAEDVEWVNPHNAVERGTRRGIGGFNQGIARVADAWVDVRFETERVIDCGEDVVALGVVRGQSRGTGIDLERPHGEIWTFRDGKVTRLRWFHSHHDTLAAAGLSE